MRFLIGYLALLLFLMIGSQADTEITSEKIGQFIEPISRVKEAAEAARRARGLLMARQMCGQDYCCKYGQSACQNIGCCNSDYGESCCSDGSCCPSGYFCTMRTFGRTGCCPNGAACYA